MARGVRVVPMTQAVAAVQALLRARTARVISIFVRHRMAQLARAFWAA